MLTLFSTAISAGSTVLKGVPFTIACVVYMWGVCPSVSQGAPFTIAYVCGVCASVCQWGVCIHRRSVSQSVSQPIHTSDRFVHIVVGQSVTQLAWVGAPSYH